jgi:hypothetical protein
VTTAIIFTTVNTWNFIFPEYICYFYVCPGSATKLKVRTSLHVAGSTLRQDHAPGSVHGRQLDGAPQTVSCPTFQARLSAPRGTLERAGGERQSDHKMSVERLQSLDPWPAAPSARMRHGYSRYVNQDGQCLSRYYSVASPCYHL